MLEIRDKEKVRIKFGMLKIIKRNLAELKKETESLRVGNKLKERKIEKQVTKIIMELKNA